MMSFCILDNYLSLLIVVSLNTMLIVSIQPELKLVNVLFRHGDRTPDKNRQEMFPNDPYINYSFFPIGYGELTNQGKKRVYELGQALRSRYKDFLGDLYLPKLVVAHSWDSDRAKMSVQLVLAALFPPTDIRQRWNANLNWQPIPATYVLRVDDIFFLSNECPKYVDEYYRILDLPEMKKKMSQFKDVMCKLTELTGKNIETSVNLLYLYQTFLSESFMNLTLPKWAYDYFPYGPLLDGVVFAYNVANYNPLIRRLFIGPMVRAIADNMIAAKNPNPPDTKIYLYSGHDSIIAILLEVFGLYEPHFPAYSSAIVIELQEINQEYYVKFLYYRGIPPIFEELQIPGYDVLCPFNKFLNLIKDLIPLDNEMICDKRQGPDFAHIKDPVDLQKSVYNLIKTFAVDKNT